MHSVTRARPLGQMGFVLSVGTFVGTQPTLMVEAAPAAVRCTAIALGYNVTLGVVGGLSPLAATWLVNRTGNDYSPAFMIMAAAAISFVAALASFKETSKASLGSRLVRLPQLDVGVLDQLAEQGALDLQPGSELGRCVGRPARRPTGRAAPSPWRPCSLGDGRLHALMIAGGVPVAANMPFQSFMSKPGKPLSARVGTSGKAAARFRLVTASTRACRRRPAGGSRRW